MHYTSMYRITIRCTTIYCFEIWYCNMLIAMHCITMHSIATYCFALYYNASFSCFQRGQLIFLIFLFVFIVVGNISVLLALGLSKRGKKSFRMSYFIMNLALAGEQSLSANHLWHKKSIWNLLTLQKYHMHVNTSTLNHHVQLNLTYPILFITVLPSLDLTGYVLLGLFQCHQ